MQNTTDPYVFRLIFRFVGIQKEDEYDLFQIFSLPIVVKGATYMYEREVQFPFIGVNRQNTYYFPIASDKARECIKAPCNLYEVRRAIKEDRCLASPLIGIPVDPLCPQITRPTEDFFEATPFGTLFSVKSEIRAHISCTRHRTPGPEATLTIKGYGMIQLKPSCILYANSPDIKLFGPPQEYVTEGALIEIVEMAELNPFSHWKPPALEENVTKEFLESLFSEVATTALYAQKMRIVTFSLIAALTTSLMITLFVAYCASSRAKNYVQAFKRNMYKRMRQTEDATETLQMTLYGSQEEYCKGYPRGPLDDERGGSLEPLKPLGSFRRPQSANVLDDIPPPMRLWGGTEGYKYRRGAETTQSWASRHHGDIPASLPVDRRLNRMAGPDAATVTAASSLSDLRGSRELPTPPGSPPTRDTAGRPKLPEVRQPDGRGVQPTAPPADSLDPAVRGTGGPLLHPKPRLPPTPDAAAAAAASTTAATDSYVPRRGDSPTTVL